MLPHHLPQHLPLDPAQPKTFASEHPMRSAPKYWNSYVLYVTSYIGGIQNSATVVKCTFSGETGWVSLDCCIRLNVSNQALVIEYLYH